MSSTQEQLLQRYKKSLLSKKETADEIGVSTATIDRLRKSGQLRSKKIGGGVFFTLQNRKFENAKYKFGGTEKTKHIKQPDGTKDNWR